MDWRGVGSSIWSLSTPVQVNTPAAKRAILCFIPTDRTPSRVNRRWNALTLLGKTIQSSIRYNENNLAVFFSTCGSNIIGIRNYPFSLFFEMGTVAAESAILILACSDFNLQGQFERLGKLSRLKILVFA